MTCQTDSDKAAPWKPDNCYGWRVCYYKHAVDSRDVEEMHQSFKRMAARSARLIAQFGCPATFGQFVARFAAIVGATEVEFLSCEHGEPALIRSPGQAVHLLDQRSRELWEACRKREHKPITEHQATIAA